VRLVSRRPFDAIGSVLTGSGWLRCRTHSANNLRAKTPKHAWPMVAGLLNSVFERPDAASVHRQYRELCAALDGKFPDAVALIESRRDRRARRLRIPRRALETDPLQQPTTAAE